MYCIKLRKRKKNWNLKKKHEILLRGELDLEKSVDLSLRQTT